MSCLSVVISPSSPFSCGSALIRMSGTTPRPCHDIPLGEDMVPVVSCRRARFARRSAKSVLRISLLRSEGRVHARSKNQPSAFAPSLLDSLAPKASARLDTAELAESVEPEQCCRMACEVGGADGCNRAQRPLASPPDRPKVSGCGNFFPGLGIARL